METLKNLSKVQMFIIGLIGGLILGWAGTFFVLDQAAWKLSSCGPGEDPKDCLERVAKEKLATKEADSKVEDGEEKTSVDASPEAKETTVSVPGTNAVAVDDQPSGDLVNVTMVTLSKAGWVAIHEDTGGVPGNVLGAHRYEPGIYLGEVTLLRPTISGKTYYAVLHLDDGDKQFDSKKDLPITGNDGKVVSDSFVAK